MDPDDFRRRVIQVSAIAGVIILVSAMESILMYYASRFDKVPRPTSTGILSGQDRVNELRRTSDEEMVRDNPLDNSNLNTTVKSLLDAPGRTFLNTKHKMESLISTDDECADTQSHKGKSIRKRSAGPSNTGNERRRKVRRISVGQEITRMAKSMETIIDSLRDIITGAVECAPRSEALELQSRAMEAIKTDEGFSDKGLKDAALVIENDPDVAHMYLSIKNKNARKSFLLHHMENFKKYD